MHTLKIWLQASRPKTWPASICPVICASALAFKENVFQFWIFLFTLLAALGIQICTNFVNDYFDFLKGADTSSRKGPVRVTQKGLVSLATMQKAIIIAFTLTSLLCLTLILKGGVVIAILSTIALILALAYTAGPLPLAYLGLGDIFVLIFFGPVATGCAYFLQSGIFSLSSLTIGLGCGLISTAILTANNLRDIEEDRQACKKTLCVRWGKKFGKMEYAACLLLAPLCGQGLLPLIAWIPSIALIWKLFKKEEEEMYQTLLAKTSVVLLLYTLSILAEVLIS